MVICQGIVREMSGNFEPTQMWQPCELEKTSTTQIKLLFKDFAQFSEKPTIKNKSNN